MLHVGTSYSFMASEVCTIKQFSKSSYPVNVIKRNSLETGWTKLPGVLRPIPRKHGRSSYV